MKPATNAERGLPDDVAPEVQTDPHARPGRDRATRETHPAYAQIGCSRISSSPGTYLFGSDFRHQHFMRIRIGAAHLERDLSRDWLSSGREYIEVSLSEAQWATFVSSPNMGTGVGCTLNWRDGHVPGILRPAVNRREQFSREAADKLDDVDAGLTSILAALNDEGVTMPQKTRKRLQALVDKAKQNLRGNLNFVAKSFDEHMEQTVERAKIEVNAYMTATVQRAGLEAIAAQHGLPLALDAPVSQPVTPADDAGKS